MPVYEYHCARCGTYADLRPMRARGEPGRCPDCGGAAPRVIETAPGLAGMPGAVRIAHETNERAAHEPRQSSRHGAGCACCKGARAPAAAAAEGTLKSQSGSRPWMIGH